MGYECEQVLLCPGALWDMSEQLFLCPGALWDMSEQLFLCPGALWDMSVSSSSSALGHYGI